MFLESKMFSSVITIQNWKFPAYVIPASHCDYHLHSFFPKTVRAFATSCIDYCSGLLAGVPKAVTDKLQRVMNSAARIVSNTWKFDHDLTYVRHDILHWLDVPEHIIFKLCMTVYKCLHGMWPIYLSEMCRPSSSEAGRRHLRSANRGQLVVPRYRLTTAGRRAFSCAGPSVWNSLPEYLPVGMLTLDCFKRSLKCFQFARYWHSARSALGICTRAVNGSHVPSRRSQKFASI